MKAKELKPGQQFRLVNHPRDPECDRRICLTNDDAKGLRFGFPNNQRYWCFMGEECEVELVQ